MRSIVVIIRGLTALVVLVVLAAGVPMLLVNVAGWPLPTAVPSWSEVSDALTRIGVADSTIVKAVALVVWLAWLQLMVSVVVEVVALARHRAVRSLPATVRPARQLAASLVTAVASLVSLAPVRAGAAEPPRLATVLTLPVASTSSLVGPTAEAPSTSAVSSPVTATAPGPPPADAGRTWTVRPRDTLWGIAEQALGAGERWREIVALNAGREVADGVILGERVDVLRPGWLLLLPPTDPTAAPTSPPRGTDSVPIRRPPANGEVSGDHAGITRGEVTTVTVARGDTLSGIAQRHYGDAARWRDLWEANRGRRFGSRTFDDPNLIFAGWDLVLPEASSTSDSAPPRSPRGAGPGASRAAAVSDLDAALVLPGSATILDEHDTPTDVEAAKPTSVVQAAAAPTTLAVPRADVSTSMPDASTPEPSPRPAGAVPGVGWSVTTGLAGAALLATGVAGLLASRRRRRLEGLELGQTLTEPDPDLAPIEQAVRRADDPLAVARLDLALRALGAVLCTAGLAEIRPLVVLHRGSGDLDVVLSGPATPVMPFSAAPDGPGWRLPATVSLSALSTLAAGVVPPAPALVGLGRLATDAGRDGDDEVYVDLEALGGLELGGPREHVRALARAVVATLAVSPLAERVQVIAAGLDCYGFTDESRVHAVADAAGALEHARSAAQPILDELERGGAGSTFALRASSQDELWEPVVVLALDDATSALEALTCLAGRGGRGVALLSDRPADGGWRLAVGPAGWRLDPLGVDVTPRGLAADELADLGALLADASSPLATAPSCEPSPQPAGPFVEQPWSLMVRLLGPVEVVDRELQPVVFERSKALELVAWLAEHREQPRRSAARAALWETEVRDTTFANVVSDARRALARRVAPPPGHEWIGRAAGDRLPLHELVVTDVELLAARVAHARAEPLDRAVRLLRDGLALVRDLPFAGTSYLWPDGAALPSHHTVLVVTAAMEMATRCLELGDTEGVLWATGQGLRALPAHEELVCLRMRAHAAAGNLAAVRCEYQGYERCVLADPWGEGVPAPKVVELRQALLGGR